MTSKSPLQSGIPHSHFSKPLAVALQIIGGCQCGCLYLVHSPLDYHGYFTILTTCSKLSSDDSTVSLGNPLPTLENRLF